MICIPDADLMRDKIDLLNYTADNTLSLINYCLENNQSFINELILVCYNPERISKIKNRIEQSSHVKIKPIIVNNPFLTETKKKKALNFIFYYYYFFTSRFIISSNVLLQFPYKSKSQVYLSLNYFTPFKLDKPISAKLNQVKYAFSTSYLSSQIVSITSKIPIEQFYNLGFSRNDGMLKTRMYKSELLNHLNLYFGDDLKIITYTPTHRNHLTSSDYLMDIFGYECSIDLLNKFLTENNSIILIKIHPSQDRSRFKSLNAERVKILEPDFNYNLYDILAYTDILITDYTSTYFDFLILNKPVIFNFPDIENYRKNRGFSYDPIELICAGNIIKSMDDLINELAATFSPENSIQNSEKFHWIKSLMHKYPDGDSSKRIFNFINNIIEQECKQ
jgi:hypothetical protein